MIMFCSRALSLTLLVISHFTHSGGVTWYMKLRIEACVSRVHSGYAFVKYSPICRRTRCQELLLSDDRDAAAETLCQPRIDCTHVYGPEHHPAGHRDAGLIQLPEVLVSNVTGRVALVH